MCGMHNIVAGSQLGQRMDFCALVPLEAAGAALARSGTAMGDHREPCLRKLKSGGQAATHHQHPAFDRRLRAGGVQRRDIPRGKVLREGFGVFLLAARQHDTGQPPVQHILKILGQQLDAAGPHRQLPRSDVVHLPQPHVRAGACKGIHQHAQTGLQFGKQAVG